MPPVVLADLVDRHDVRMIQLRGGLGFRMEPLHFLATGELAGEDQLEGDDAVEADLAGAINRAHAAAGELTKQLVVAKGVEWGGGGFAGRCRWHPPARGRE